MYIIFRFQAKCLFLKNSLVHLLFKMIDFQCLLKAILMILANPDACGTDGKTDMAVEIAI